MSFTSIVMTGFTQMANGSFLLPVHSKWGVQALIQPGNGVVWPAEQTPGRGACPKGIYCLSVHYFHVADHMQYCHWKTAVSSAACRYRCRSGQYCHDTVQ